MTDIKLNISANLVSQLYAALVAIVMLPVYLNYMGAEAYGLVGFFTMAQAWFALLDFGMSPMLTRFVARYRGGVVSAVDLVGGLRAVAVGACIVAVASAAAIVAFSGQIAEHWLRSVHLESSELAFCIVLMAPTFAMRFVSSLLRAVVFGFEALVLLSWFSVLIGSIRFIGVLPVFWVSGSGLRAFFWFQLLVAALELAIFVSIVVKLAPPTPRGPGTQVFSLHAVKPEIYFALSASFTGFVWIVVTQLDKMLLSNILPLDQYGYYTLCTTAANGILLLSSPIGVAILPSLTRLQAGMRHGEVIELYRRGTQIAMIVTAPAVVMLTIFSHEVLGFWTGDQTLAASSHQTLSLYAAGTSFLVAGSFQYLLQVSQGNLRLHILGNLIFAVVLVPALYLFASSQGMVGAAWVWLICNAATFLFWTPIVHSRYLPGRHWRWLLNDVLRIWIPPFVVGLVLRGVLSWPEDRVRAALQATVIGVCLLAVAAASSTTAMQFVSRRLRLR